MPIKDKSMSVIRVRPSSEQNLLSLFEDIFYRDKSGLLSGSALKLYNKICKENGIRSSEWQNHISEVFSVKPILAAESDNLKEICDKHSGILKHKESKSGLRGKKPYQVLMEKHMKGEIKLGEAETNLLGRVSKWFSAVSSYYSIINKLKAIGMIEKKESNYILSNRFTEKLKSIEKILHV
jgi:hypothetical protein